MGEAFYRTSFTIGSVEEIESAVIWQFATNLTEIHLNGCLVKRCHGQEWLGHYEVNLRPCLRVGKNVLAIRVIDRAQDKTMLAAIRHASGSWAGANGTTSAEWRRTPDGGIHYRATIPAGTAAELHLPGQSPTVLAAGDCPFHFDQP